ncbi:TadE/TadG family type IV pilus assembly protein [Nocardioides sp. REDSEA-S30_B4]|jgi:hypothetical protein|uniref:TadE/TadG family type IV pilus assembly protein n=1 Tax=Nocardioides sp. REDSEA-S30_B4 TaxID=1811552 RepID=UPI0025F82160|nr:TadE/TadG family type IV pilus assembly protein [Nocardioides sp. REDSEA-S30_B4]
MDDWTGDLRTGWIEILSRPAQRPIGDAGSSGCGRCRTVQDLTVSRSRRASEEGAVAVEAALVIAALLVPLLLGVVTWGDYFFRAQRVDTLAPGVPVGGVAGEFTCQGLKDRVASTVVDVVGDLDASLVGIEVSDVTVSVVEVLPDVGVVVDIHIETPLVGGLASLIPLPGGGSIVTDFSQRLEDVTVTDAVCT